MNWLLDEKGNIVLRNGKPVAIGPDGKEFEYDIKETNTKLVETIAEATKHRKGKAELKAQLEKIPEEIVADPDKYVSAFTTVESLDDKNKADIEKMKKELKESYESANNASVKRISELEGQIYKEKVTNRFATSESLKGTIFENTREIAESYFGKHFKVDENGNMIGTTEDGSTIYSKEKPGEAAGFDECLSTLINTHPKRDSFIAASNQRGSGNPPANNNGDTQTASAHENIVSGLAARKAS